MLVFVFIDIVDELARVFDDDFHEVIVGVIDAVDVAGVLCIAPCTFRFGRLFGRIVRHRASGWR